MTPAPRRQGLRVLSGWLQGVLWAAAAAGGLAALLAVGAAGTSEDVRNGSATARDLVAAEDAFLSATGFWFMAFVAAGVLWIVWLHRTHRLVEAARGSGGRHSRGWTIGAWFVPIGNLWLPKQIHDDLHRASVGNPAARVPPVLHWWWGTWLVAGVLRVASGGGEGGLDTAALTTFYTVNAVWGVGEVAAAVVAVFAVRHLTRQVDGCAAVAGHPDH